MKSSTIGRRYGRALLELAKESGELAKVKTDLADVAATWRENAELRAIFENPKHTAEARRAVLDGLGQKMGLSSLVVRTLKLLSDRRRARAIPDVAAAFETLAEESSGQLRAEVTTASPMPDTYYAELGKVLEKVTGRKVAIVKQTDPTLIGGVVARVGDRVFDGSLKNRLSDIKDTLLLN